MNIDETISILQVAVGPVILVSGVGLLLLTMTNRLARVVDRARYLARELRAERGAQRARDLAQLRIFRRRGVQLRRAIELASFSVLLVAGLVIVLFVTALTGHPAGLVAVVALFAAAMTSLMASLALFIRDMHDALRAVELELADVDPEG